MGMLIWTELPNGGMATDRSRGRKEKLLKGIVDRDANHPSIIIWTIINENWGVDLVNDADHRDWLKRTFAWLKAYDPTRLVVDNSPLAPSFHVESDIADYHFYAAIPDHRDEWDQFVDELASRASWLYSPHGDAVITGREPLMCSEFGNWGLPYPKDLRDEKGEEPWWFETGHDWGEGVMYAHGVENRFSDWSLDRVFGDLRRFVIAAQWQQFRALKYEIESMRRKPTLAGYVITELHDCHWESNGLLDMRRNPRVFHELFHIVNSDTVIVPKWERPSYWSGETAQVQLAIAHGAGPVLEDCHLEIALGDETKRLPPAAHRSAGSARSRQHRLHVPDYRRGRPCGASLSSCALPTESWSRKTISTSPFTRKRADPSIRASCLVATDEDIARAFRARSGYGCARALDGIDAHRVAQLTITAIADHVRAGRKPPAAAGERDGLYPFFPHWQNVRVRPARRHALARRLGLVLRVAAAERDHFARFPCGPLLDETMDRVLPDLVIAGCNLLDFQARVFAGLVVGWIHKPVALGVERSYGRGRHRRDDLPPVPGRAAGRPDRDHAPRRPVELALESRAPRTRRSRPGGGSRGVTRYSAANWSRVVASGATPRRRAPASSASAMFERAPWCADSSSRCASRGRHRAWAGMRRALAARLARARSGPRVPSASNRSGECHSGMPRIG